MNGRTARFAMLAAAATVLVALGGCASGAAAPSANSSAGSGGALTPVSFSLNFTPSGAQAGFTYAKALGYYKDAGLDVTIQPSTGSVATAQLVASGGIDIGYTDAPSAFQIASQGGDIKVVSPVLQTNGFAVISLADTGFTSLTDLKGKKVGLQPATGNAQLFQSVLSQAGLSESDIQVVSVQPSALQAALLGHQVDAIVTGGDTQVPLLELAGNKLKYWMFYQVGVPTVGLSITASSKYIAAHPDVISKFTEASLRGWAEAQKNPSDAAQSMVDQFPTSGTEQQVEAMLKVDLGLLCAAGGSTMGPVSDDVWSKTEQLLKDTQLLPANADVTAYIDQKAAGSDFPAC